MIKSKPLCYLLTLFVSLTPSLAFAGYSSIYLQKDGTTTILSPNTSVFGSPNRFQIQSFDADKNSYSLTITGALTNDGIIYNIGALDDDSDGDGLPDKPSFSFTKNGQEVCSSGYAKIVSQTRVKNTRDEAPYYLDLRYFSIDVTCSSKDNFRLDYTGINFDGFLSRTPKKYQAMDRTGLDMNCDGKISLEDVDVLQSAIEDGMADSLNDARLGHGNFCLLSGADINVDKKLNHDDLTAFLIRLGQTGTFDQM